MELQLRGKTKILVEPLIIQHPTSLQQQALQNMFLQARFVHGKHWATLQVSISII